MPFDAAWFDELRTVSEAKLRLVRENGIEGFAPQVGELCRDEHVSVRFVEETEHLIRLLDRTAFCFGAAFRAYERHVVAFPKGRAFRKQWNIGFTAGVRPDDDHVRIGIGFRLSDFWGDTWADDATGGIEEYLLFREQARLRSAEFDALFEGLGGYYEIDGRRSALDPAGGAKDRLSAIVVADNPWPECWRFFGRRLMVRDADDRAIIRSHERLRDVAIDVFDRIQRAGFGM